MGRDTGRAQPACIIIPYNTLLYLIRPYYAEYAEYEVLPWTPPIAGKREKDASQLVEAGGVVVVGVVVVVEVVVVET